MENSVFLENFFSVLDERSLGFVCFEVAGLLFDDDLPVVLLETLVFMGHDVSDTIADVLVVIHGRISTLV